VTAAKTLGYPSTVIVPSSTKPHMIEKIKLAGASEVVQHGATWFEADTYLREQVLPQDKGGVYVPPFDHPEVWNGNATIAQEVIQQLSAEPDAVVCSVGGGGLFCGIAQGLQGTKTRIAVVETKGAESLHEAIKAGKLITLPGITSIATSLGATTVAPKALEWGLKENVRSVVVSDEEACRACVRFAEDERMLVEPACGATIALAYEGRLAEAIEGFNQDSVVVLVVCGGRNVGLEVIEEWKQKYC
jgi:L-serine/L-threonine ammonia-lyase